MRHRKSFNHLSRKTGHRRAMLANMASSLIKHKRIKTTTAKAKALRVYVEPLITKSKNDTTHSRRTVFSYLQDKDAVSELFRDVAVKVADRPGGYTRILKLGNRPGDSAEMAIIELVDYNENLLEKADASKSGTRRRRRRGGGGAQKAEKSTEKASTDIEEAQVIEEEKLADSPEEEKQQETASAETTQEVQEEKTIEKPEETKSANEGPSDEKEEKKAAENEPKSEGKSPESKDEKNES